ncbi:MAG: hypothetical protein JKX94_05845 [Sneathiella sp.]|nr:hypothetical protein [Sneathiella sp.]
MTNCKTALALLSMASLSACAGSTPWNEQNYAGVNKAEIEFDTQGNPTHALIIGGKEQEQIQLSVKTPKGLEVKYSATGVKAFEGQSLRAAVEIAVSKEAKEIMPNIVDAIMNAVQVVLEK